MGKITKIKCSSDEEWRFKRNADVGGSDAAIVLGLSPYKGAYALWAEKTCKLPIPDISDKEAVRLGNDLEDYVAKRFVEATEKKVRRDNHLIYNSDYPFAHASVDRMVVGEDAGLECKTTSSWEIGKQLKDGIIPDYWYCQCVHYMMVTESKKWYLAALVFGSGFYYFEIARDEGEIKALARAESDFMELVRKDTPPAIDGSQSSSQAVKTIFGESIPGTSLYLDAIRDKVNAYLSLEKQIKELTTLQEEFANVIKDYMGQQEKGICGDITVTWKSSSRKTFDKALYEERNGKIPDEYYKESSSRTFRITEKKAKK